jgi:nicotinate-nucleotide adenylyltransferase
LRIAVYGGSFNPPHVGHALVASWLRFTDQCDEVWLLPAYQHAFHKELIPFTTRVRWCRAMANEVGPWVVVEDIEGLLPVPSYTIDTLLTLKAKYPEHDFRLVVGADVLPATPLWKQWGRIVEEFHPILVGRAGYESPPDALMFPDVSSTEIRRRLRNKEPIDTLVVSSVAALLRSEPVFAHEVA